MINHTIYVSKYHPYDSIMLQIKLWCKWNIIIRFYYTSNIHYDLFRYDASEKDQLEERILYFLENADRRTIKRRNGWFILNFPVDFFRYLIHVYQVDVDAVEKAMTGSKSKQKNIPSIKLKNRDLEELTILVEGYGKLIQIKK